jgi:V/A-type H+-transporting ATPase subunit D
MAIKFQYNKTSLQGIEKQLKMRLRALPTIKNKESALRMEVNRAKDEAQALKQKFETQLMSYEKMAALWTEFEPSLVSVQDVQLSTVKIAGIRVPMFGGLVFATRPFSMFNSPEWYVDGIHLLQTLATTGIEYEFCVMKVNLLEHARKKTTQKVNLFEKVQIPGYEDAIRKIKRFMEDEENLSKSSQKIMKSKQASNG